MTIPRCVRGPHLCDELCSVAHGQPCQPPDGEAWRPHCERLGFQRGTPVANYRVMREALGPGDLTDEQQRYLRWLARWDDPTTQALASLFRFARGDR